MKRTLFAFITLLIISSGLFAQSKKKSPEYDLKKNVVRWNITPFLLWGNKNLEFGYERVITPIIKDIVVDKYPGMENLLKDQTFNTNGVYSIWTAGYRYVIQIGILI